MSHHQESPETSADQCANCGAPLRGPFCSQCGQAERNPARTRLSELAEEWLGDIFAFDSRIGRTLTRLVRRPGALTVEYMAGRRERYVPPFRLFLFISVVMFIVLGLTETTLVSNVTVAPSDSPTESASPSNATDPEPAPDSSGRVALSPEAQAEINQRFMGRLPQAMFLLAPVFALLLWLARRRAVPLYVPHLIFSLHVHAFAFAATASGALIDFLLGKLGFTPGSLLALVSLPIYLFLAQRRVYGGARWRTLLLTTALIVGQLMVLFLVLFGLLFFTLGTAESLG